jgi:hypothetical protein
VVGGGTDVGRPEVPREVVVVSDGVGTSVGLPVVVGTGLGVGCSRVVVGAGVVVVGGSLAGGVVAAGAGLPVLLFAVLGASGLMLRYSVKIARKSTERTTVDVRARPR